MQWISDGGAGEGVWKGTRRQKGLLKKMWVFCGVLWQLSAQGWHINDESWLKDDVIWVRTPFISVVALMSITLPGKGNEQT